VLYNAVENRDYIHIVGTEGNTAGDVASMVAYVRCYIKDGPGTLDTLYSQNVGVTYKNIAGNYAGALSTITHFDSSCSITPVVVVSPVSKRVAIAFLKPACNTTSPPFNCDYASDVCYIESMNNGDDWVGPAAGAAGYWLERNLTNYGCSGTERAYSDLNACYDYQDSLHIVFVTAGFDPGNPGYYQPGVARLYHWSKKSGSPVGTPNMIAYKIQENCHPGAHNVNIAKMSISAKDPIYHPGGDSVYLYAIWTQFDSLDQASSKARPYGNGDIWGCGSFDGGKSWDNTYNLTNTQTPGCTPGTCVSEHWSSLAQNMYNGDLHIQYICDRDPGFPMSGQDDGSTWQDDPVMYLHLGEWALGCVPRGAYQIISPDRWLKPPLKIAPNGNKVLTFKVSSIGCANLIYSVTSDDACIQVSVPPTALPGGTFATVTVNVIGTGACNNSFIDGHVILNTNEGGSKTDYLPVQAVVSNDYYECPVDPVTNDSLYNGVMLFYANSNCQEWMFDSAFAADTCHEVFFQGGTFVAVTQSGDTLAGRFMGDNDQNAGARQPLYRNSMYSNFWLEYTWNTFIHKLNPPVNPKWWWWEILKEIVFFKSNAANAYKHSVIKFITVERHNPPTWWPSQPTFTNYEDTYIGIAMDIDCPWDTMQSESGRNLAYYDATKNIAYQTGYDYTGIHPEYDNYVAGIALIQGKQAGESTVPYGAYNVKNHKHLYPQSPWGWLDGDLYRLAKDPLPADIEDPDSIVDRTQVFTARKIDAGTNPNARASFTVVEAAAYSGLAQLQAYVDSARAWVLGKPFILCGDCNNSGVIEVGDVTTLIGYLYKGGQPPVGPMMRGDCNASGVIEVGDVTTLIGYLYKGGQPPKCLGIW
jgi:hypothetical protein